MFPFWTSHSKPRQLLSDDALESSKKNDTYLQRKRVMDVISYLAVSIVTFFGFFTLYMIVFDESFREAIANIIKSEFKPIVYALFAVLGIRILDKN